MRTLLELWFYYLYANDKKFNCYIIFTNLKYLKISHSVHISPDTHIADWQLLVQEQLLDWEGQLA